MEWLDPWGPADDPNKTFQRELETEVRRGHPLYKVPVRLIGRGNADDCLFALLDGSDRVAVVHLVWQGAQKPPWPGTAIYQNLDAWCIEHMLPEHKEWTEE